MTSIWEKGKHVVQQGVEVVDNTIKAGSKVVEASYKVAVAPTKVLIDVATGKPVETDLKKVVDVVADASSAVTLAATTPDFVAIDLAGYLAGKTGADIARIATAGQVIALNTPDMLIQQLRKGGMSPAEVAALPFATVLAAALKAASEQFKSVAKPIPDMVKTLLAPTFPGGLLDRARYVIGKFGLSLPEVINGANDFMGNHSFAVSVPGIIVFSAEPGGTNEDLHWWAHELEHLHQYEDLGVERFARKYITNYKRLEEDAESVASQAGKRRSVRRGPARRSQARAARPTIHRTVRRTRGT